MTEKTAQTVEEVLRDELVRGDAAIASAHPVLRHLLASDDNGLFSDELVARVRGMVLDVAEQFLFAQAAAAEARDRPAYVSRRLEQLAAVLLEDGSLLSHAHALTIEAQHAERLQGRSGVDPVLTPLVQELAAAPDPGRAELAIAVLAAQARFQQHARRMELPLRELPGELMHKVLVLARGCAAPEDSPAAEAAERTLRGEYEEGAGRLGLIARLVLAMGEDAASALAIDRAGLGIFATALSMASGQERDLVLLSFAERRHARLVLSLRAAGLEQRATVEQFLLLHPDLALPDGFEILPSERASALLAASCPQAVA